MKSDINELLQRWDAGEEIETCEMGGLGESYELAIHKIAFEILRSMQEIPFNYEEYDTENIDEERKSKWRDYVDTLETTPNVKNIVEKIGPTGAMWGAAVNIASVFDRNGVEQAINKIPEDRLIFIKNT